MNGRTLGDSQGKFTCYQPAGTSTVDYAIVNETLLDHVETVSSPHLSDHCSIKLRLKVNTESKPQENNLRDREPAIRWTEKTKQMFTQSINSSSTKMAMKNIESLLDKEDNTHIDAAIGQVNDIFTLKGIWRKKVNSKPKKDNKKWYDSTCADMSRRIKSLGKLCEHDPKNPFLRGNMITARKEYRKLIKLKKHQWIKSNQIKSNLFFSGTELKIYNKKCTS